MPSKKSKRKNNQKKTKKKTAAVTSPRKKPVKAGSAKKSLRRSARKAETSKRSRSLRNRSQIDALNDIERETRNQTLTSAGGAGPQSDFQGLSRAEEADSESVEELVEEGNILESGAVAGVEQADNEDEREVRTRELPEDDVPDEYLEKD